MSQGIDDNKTDDPREYIFCHYCSFLETNSKFQAVSCNGCDDLMQRAMSFNDVATVNVKEYDYRVDVLYMS